MLTITYDPHSNNSIADGQLPYRIEQAVRASQNNIVDMHVETSTFRFVDGVVKQSTRTSILTVIFDGHTLTIEGNRIKNMPKGLLRWI